MKQYRIQDSIFYSFLLVGFVVFYFKAHPIIPFDADDWDNLNFFRGAYPSLEKWNPTKVFPECFEPLAGLFAAYIVKPMLGDYLDALILTNSLVLSLFIIGYLYQVHKLIEEQMGLSNVCCYFLVALFILFHFLILRWDNINNEYLWFSPNANCYYHYTIPNLLCCSLVLYLLRHGLSGIWSTKKTAISVLLFYLALCSNLFSTIILVAYFGARLLVNLFNIEKGIFCYIKQHRVELLFVLSWVVIQIIEANGARASNAHLDDSIVDYAVLTLRNFFHIHYNVFFITICFLSIGGAFCVHRYLFQKSFHVNKQLMVLSISLFLATAYQILLCSRVDPTYIQKGQVIFPFAFYFLLLVILCFSYLAKNVHWVKIFLPMIVFVSIFEINDRYKVYRDVQFEFTDNLEFCEEFDRVLIEEARLAAMRGEDSLVCIVPNFGFWDNWPFGYNFLQMGTTLQKHGVVPRKIKIILRTDPNLPLHQLSEPFFLRRKINANPYLPDSIVQ